MLKVNIIKSASFLSYFVYFTSLVLFRGISTCRQGFKFTPWYSTHTSPCTMNCYYRYCNPPGMWTVWKNVPAVYALLFVSWNLNPMCTSIVLKELTWENAGLWGEKANWARKNTSCWVHAIPLEDDRKWHTEYAKNYQMTYLMYSADFYM
jgi:hypothetical protein